MPTPGTHYTTPTGGFTLTAYRASDDWAVKLDDGTTLDHFGSTTGRDEFQAYCDKHGAVADDRVPLRGQERAAKGA